MLTLITGQPGNGKTLHALWLVEKLRQESGRPVYYWSISELALPWVKIADSDTWDLAKRGDDTAAQACDWYDRPDGSIIVIDECQHVFRPRKQGAPVPRRTQEFETHRHRGFDVFLITQHPQLLDINVRKLVGRHIHVKRNFGRETATLNQWEEAVNPQDRSYANRALKTTWTFPKDVYAWYKSAEVHTVKKDFPVKPVAVLVGSLVAVVALGWFAIDRLTSRADGSAAEEVAVVDQRADLHAAHLEARSLIPRVPTWPWSAPAYDKIAEFRSYPRITGCMKVKIDSSETCTCHDGQGVAQVSGAVCRDFMAGRYFDPTREVVDVKAENIRRLDAAQSSQPGTQADASSSPRQTEGVARSEGA